MKYARPTHWLSRSLRGRGLMLALIYLLYYLSLVSWTPFFPVYLRQAGLSGLQVGTLTGMGLAIMLISQPLWGLVADLRGRRPTMLLAMLLSALLLLGYAWPGGFWFLAGWTLLYGLLSKGTGPLLDSLVLDHLEEHRDLSFGQLRVWGGVAWALGALTVGRAVAGRDIRLVFAFGAGFMLLACMVAWHGTSERAGRVALGKSWRGAPALLRSRRFVTFLVLAMLLYLGTAPVWSFYPIYMTELGARSDAIGLAFTLRGLGEMPLYLVAAAIIRRFTLRRTIAFSCLMFAARLFLYSALRTPAPAIAVELCHGLTFSLFLVSAVEYVNRHVPREWRATGQTLFAALYYGAGGILGNTWAGYLFDRLGVQGMFRVNGFIVLTVALLTLAVLRDRKGAPGGETAPARGG